MGTLSIQGLHASIVGSATVLNDGKSPNTLAIALTNSNMFEGNSAETDIVIKAENNLALYFIADDASGAVGKDQFRLNWALSSRARIQSARVHLYLPGETVDYSKLKDQTQGWTITPGKAPEPVDKEGNIVPNATISSLQGWELTPAADCTLKAGESLLVVISNIITDLPDGPSQGFILLKYGGVNHFTKFGPVQKTPNYIGGGFVGINTNTPRHPLSIASDIGTKISLWDYKSPTEFYGFGISPSHLNYQVLDAGAHAFRAGGLNDDGRLLLNIQDGSGGGAVTVQGKLGIGMGTKNPNELLNLGDTETAISQDGQGNLTLHTGNNERVRISKEGNVGIGTTDPAFPLSITGANLGNKLALWSHSKDLWIGFGVSEGQLNYQVSENVSHVFLGGSNGSKEFLRINPEGNVGIGTTDPAFPLSITGANVGNKLALWSHSKDLWIGFGVSEGQLNYRVSANQSHVFYGSTDDSKELMRLNPDAITLHTNLKYTGNQPLIRFETIAAGNNGDNPEHTDTGISFWDYPIASISGWQADYYDLDAGSARAWKMQIRKGDNGTWEIVLQMPANGNSKGIWKIDVIAYHKSIT